MPVLLGDPFFRTVRSSPVHHEHDGRQLTIEPFGRDMLRVQESGKTVAYITGYTESESGILGVNDPKDILPPVFYTLEDAVASLKL